MLQYKKTVAILNEALYRSFPLNNINFVSAILQTQNIINYMSRHEGKATKFYFLVSQKDVVSSAEHRRKNFPRKDFYQIL